MTEYHKIQTVYKREPEKPRKIIEGQFSLPEFEYLKDCSWEGTEKINGMNVRIVWQDGKVLFQGKTDNAMMPPKLLIRLAELFPVAHFKHLYLDTPMCLYGEGYGTKIQSGGKYKSDGVDFVLFDIKIGDYWLERKNIMDIAGRLGIDIVPVVYLGKLLGAIEMVKSGLTSLWGDFPAEGMVLRPTVELFSRRGDRIITKIKHKDFVR